jgi:hypothetical protein
LRQLSLYRAEGVTDRGVAALHQSLPQCEISR